MIKVTSKNRTQAKRLLNNWHDSKAVRMWTLDQLEGSLRSAVSLGLITEQGVNRTLEREQETPPPSAPDPDDSGNDPRYEPTDAEYEEGADSPESGETDTPSEQPDTDQDDSPEQEDNASPPEGADEGANAADSDSDADSEPEPETESEEESNESPDHEMLPVVLKYIGAGLNVALVGPAGTGKSYLARQVAGILGLDYYVNGALLSKYDLVGYNDAGGQYHSTPAHDAFLNGGLHCFDEADASAPDAMVAFNGMTDDQPYFTFPDGQIEQHPNYVAICCMNTWGNGASADYVGRYKQDAAAMSRFVKVFIDYDPAIEARMGPPDIVERVQAVRVACSLLAIRHVVSTRMIVQATAARKGSEYGRATKCDVDRDIIFAGLEDSTIKQIKATMKAQAAGTA